MESAMRVVPLEPAKAGAVPTTATLPATAALQVATVLKASEGTVVAHVPPLLGSPMTMAEYEANWALVRSSQVAGVSTVTV
jgi:hypothetical protein